MSSTNLLCGNDVGEGESSAFYMGPANTAGEGDQNIDLFCVSLMLDEGRGCAQHRTLMTVRGADQCLPLLTLTTSLSLTAAQWV